GSLEIAAKAFTILNSEKNRALLKQSFFEWLGHPSIPSSPNFELFLKREFLKHVRKEDVRRTYEKLLPLSSPTLAVKKFLNEPQIAQFVFSGHGEGRSFEKKVLAAKSVTAEAKQHIVDSTDQPDLLFAQLLDDFSVNSEDALVRCLSRIKIRNGIDCWSDLISILERGQTPNLIRQLVIKIREEMESNPSATPFRLVEYANDLYRVSQNQYPEIVSTLNSVGSTIVSNALKGSNQGTHEFLGRAIKKQIDEATSVLVAERDKFHAACAALKSQTEVAEREVTRLKNLVDMLKSSVSQAKEDVELNVSAEVVRPFILLLDDFERQANGDRQPSFEGLLGQLRNAIDRAGVERMGTSGSCESFDPSRHELLEESDGSFSRVRI